MYSSKLALTVSAVLIASGLAFPRVPHDISINPTAAVLASAPMLERQAIDNTCGRHPDHMCLPDSPGGGPCCSYFGYCGQDLTYCGHGCQPAFGECKNKYHQYERCGPKHKNKKCTGGECCSKNGICGTGDAFCGTHCQPGFGHCPAAQKPSPTQAPQKPAPKPEASQKAIPPPAEKSDTPRCGKDFGDAVCPFPGCCSVTGHCGTGEHECSPAEHCQEGFGVCNSSDDILPQSAGSPGKVFRCGKNHNNAVCPYPNCCSTTGFCGTSKDHCGAPANCQEAFGVCDSSRAPHGLNTSAEIRERESKVPYGKLIGKCEKSRTIALTFDDGPSEHTEQILDLLRDRKAHATFFLTPNNNGKGQIDITPRWTKLVKRMAMEGHQVGVHTWSHVDMDAVSSRTRKNEMWKAERSIANIIGRFPSYMRAPYLRCSKETGCMKDVTDLGYHLVGFEVDSHDWILEESLNSMRTKIDRVFAQKHDDGNMFVIQHDHSEWSVELTKHILDKAAAKGWSAETLGSCLTDPDSIWYYVPRGTALQTIPTDGCVLAAPSFCGNIQPFHNRESCHKSVQACVKDAKDCTAKLGRDKIACNEFAHICELQDHHCKKCHKDDCHSKNWVFDRKKELKSHK